ncbi:hypothetical protein CVT25_012666, partial [Psilocybe cyanescens]
MANRLLVEGALPRPPPGVAAHPRLEITRFIADIRQFSLYVQALQVFYDRDRNNVASYWQIGGIHGQPYVDWDGTPSGGRGYCVHRTELFPTWHRPYVVLFEQEVQRIARQIAATYTYDRPIWEGAALSLRQPYWGWDNLATVVPPDQVISSPTVQIMRPIGPALVSVPNPFLTYTYPANANAVFTPPFNGWPRTVRYPDGAGNSQPTLLRTALQVEAQQIVNDTQRLFSLTTWNAFTLGSGATNGLENIHDTVHLRTGGGGNMSSVATAAFDPIFYLHHAQVDRVIDQWYRRHRVWTPNAANLLPFRRTQAAYWQSPAIIDNNGVFNYSYDGIINSTQSASSEGAAVDEPTTATNSVALEWSVRVQCKEYEVGGSFSVYIFIANEVPPNHAEWLLHPAFAGTFDVFANTNPEQCENCSAHADDIIK